jgi:enoyl-CoA hydratase/carnithine racemase
LNLLEDDAELWAGVLTGTSTVFSAGTDLRDGSGQPRPAAASTGSCGAAARHR